MKEGVCPANSYLSTESYGQEMSSGDPLRFRKVIKYMPHKPKTGHIVIIDAFKYRVCKDCLGLYLEEK